MKRTLPLLVLATFLAACSTAYVAGRVPFPRSSVVAEYQMAALGDKITQQDDYRRHPPATNIVAFKYYPSPKEFRKLQSTFQNGDTLVEFKNDDWFVGIDRMSESAERAFCVVRSGRIVKTVKIWPTDQEE
jgi:hypothetical protein